MPPSSGPPVPSPLELLARTPYLLLTTFRRDGTPVATPVWAARIGGELAVWTNPTAGKIKRIRRDPHVTVAPCGQRGRPLGRAIDGTARILTGEELEPVLPALIGKYGWKARLTQIPNRLGALFGRPAQLAGGLAIIVGR